MSGPLKLNLARAGPGCFAYFLSALVLVSYPDHLFTFVGGFPTPTQKEKVVMTDMMLLGLGWVQLRLKLAAKRNGMGNVFKIN